ncbi:MAG: hypothetical protein K8R21_14330 [Leptospira sp.]|nr:hypothetical protein [Leptospira sp.]
MPSIDAQSQINAAIQFKLDKCNADLKKKDPSTGFTYQAPQPWLYVIGKPVKRNVDLCSLSIMRVDCPFIQYPLICLLIYDKKGLGEIPWYFNFNEIIKAKL